MEDNIITLQELFTDNEPPGPESPCPLFVVLLYKGNVEKSRQRRSRPFAVLTYYEYAPRVKRAAALLDRPFGKTQGMLF